MKRVLALVSGLLAFAAHAQPCGFADVDAGSPFCTSITWIRNRGITQGCSADLYCPAQQITRVQMAAFLSRLGAMTLPPLHDAQGTHVGSLVLVPVRDPAAQDNLVYAVAAVSIGGTVFHADLQRTYSGFATTITSLWYERANCDEGGRKWVTPSTPLPVPLTSRRAVAVNFGPGGSRFVALGDALVLPAGTSWVPGSYRTAGNGECLASGVPIIPSFTIREVSGYSTTGFQGGFHVR